MNSTEEKEPTPEEIAAFEKSRHEYCDRLLPLLRKEAELAELQFKVDNFYLNRRIVKAKLAEMEAPREGEQKDKK